MKSAYRARRSLWVIFRIPILLAVLSGAGLVSALVGDSAWDVTSWLMLLVPVAVIAWALRPGRPGVRRR